MRKLIILFTLLLIGCAKSTTQDAPKSTFSAWTEAQTTIDLSHGAGSFAANISQNGTVACSCSFTLSGNHLGGDLTISACSQPVCSSFEGVFTYAYATDQTLELCRTSDHSCVTYH